MNNKLPKFYHQWIRDDLLIPFPSQAFQFSYHEGKHYAYLIGRGEKDRSDNLFIHIFLHTDVRGKMKEPIEVQYYQIQDSAVVVERASEAKSHK